MGCGGLLLILGGMCCCLHKRNTNRLLSRYNRGDDGDSDDDDVLLLDLANSGSTRSPSTAENNADYFDPQMTLQRKSVKLDKVIGEGNFGKVHSGTAKDPQRGSAVVAVAVKTPSANARFEFEAEMEIMGQLTRLGGHEHIVRVVGCIYGKRPMLVLELCAGGSLKAALTASRKEAATGNRFAISDLVTFGHQVALAMTFLERHHLLHRDLAARNVLLANDDDDTAEQQPQHMVCKLADFGLSKQISMDSKDYYRRTAGASVPIPVRWMAPETLDDDVSTIMSDRWSYGVLLWEIYSLGLRPYAGVSNAEVASCVRQGHRLEQPKLCPDGVYELMLECWSLQPEARPPFVQVAGRLYNILSRL